MSGDVIFGYKNTSMKTCDPHNTSTADRHRFHPAKKKNIFFSYSDLISNPFRTPATSPIRTPVWVFSPEVIGSTRGGLTGASDPYPTHVGCRYKSKRGGGTNDSDPDAELAPTQARSGPSGSGPQPLSDPRTPHVPGARAPGPAFLVGKITLISVRCK